MDAKAGLSVPFLAAWADDEVMFANFLFGRSTHVGPDLERTLAMSSIGQDEFGHAGLILELFIPDERERERYHFERDVSQYRCCALLEDELIDDWTAFVARAFLYEEAEAVRLEQLEELLRDVPELRERVRVMAREEQEHRPHWVRWIRILSGSPEGRRRLEQSVEMLSERVCDVLWVAEGAPAGWDPVALRQRWARRVEAVLGPVGLRSTALLLDRIGQAPRAAQRSEAFAVLVGRLQETYRSEPAARTWA